MGTEQVAAWPSCREAAWDAIPSYEPPALSEADEQLVDALLSRARVELVDGEAGAGPGDGWKPRLPVPSPPAPVLTRPTAVAERIGPQSWGECGPVEHWHLRRRRARMYENRAGEFARPPVVLYAQASVASAMNRPTRTLAHVRMWSEGRFGVVGNLWDQPGSRVQLDEAVRWCRRGLAHGIVALSPQSVADTPAAYEACLDRLEGPGHFMQHPPVDWRLM
ncbi:hypothetical protein ACIPPN_26905 [Streptomyces diastaticus]|uniref:Uncharacterized protein n=1 Tax=Streptomyces diastaticus subsp. diastaticus TaxID=68040 RepID=A0ABQ1CYI4_STRDI|nr:hypothetical protein [Streptomyces diastaticus]GFH75176.1 hypothetical protein Sdia_59440 [Streptomyces diastaticus subsp. diastaticus]GGU45114.1 hypothetical protein GCM10015534_54530 [Streptomyces diastaticus subsp. diastaticus]